MRSLYVCFGLRGKGICGSYEKGCVIQGMNITSLTVLRRIHMEYLLEGARDRLWGPRFWAMVRLFQVQRGFNA